VKKKSQCGKWNLGQCGKWNRPRRKPVRKVELLYRFRFRNYYLDFSRGATNEAA